MFMVNHVTKKTTNLQWTDIRFQTGLDAKDFSKNSLKRAR
jgi:hypothetical protein